MAQLWFSGKELLRGNKLKEFVGNNEKTKLIVKISKRGSGAPPREPVMNDEERKQFMLQSYNRQEELKVSGKFYLDSYFIDLWPTFSIIPRSILYTKNF